MFAAVEQPLSEVKTTRILSPSITPDYPVRLNGYGGRRKEVEGVEQRLFAKAIGARERCRPARRFKPLPPRKSSFLAI